MCVDWIKYTLTEGSGAVGSIITSPFALFPNAKTRNNIHSQQTMNITIWLDKNRGIGSTTIQGKMKGEFRCDG